MSIADQFRGLPIEELIGGPLAAACKAQYDLASCMVTFNHEIGFKSEIDYTEKVRAMDYSIEEPQLTYEPRINAEQIEDISITRSVDKQATQLFLNDNIREYTFNFSKNSISDLRDFGAQYMDISSNATVWE
ncbi:MAG: hypothetical protein ACJAXJ_004070 [Colwellia sp.]|jgi:hypothetical protein